MQPLIITQYFHPEPTGSAPPVSDFARWLAEHGKAPKVVTARPSYPNRFVFEGYRRGERDCETWEGVAVRRLPSFVSQSSGLFGRLISEGSFFLSLVFHRLWGSKSDAVVCVCPSIFMALVAPLFVSSDGRLLVIVHDIQSGLGRATGAPDAAMRILERLERVALNNADAIVTLSSGMEDALRARGVTTPIEILPPQIDVNQFTVSPDPDTGIALYSGAMGRKQGLHQILDAAEILQSRGSRVRFIIRGEGGVKEELVRSTIDRGLNNLTFEPLAPQNELAKAMALGSVHLVPQAADGADFAVPSKAYSIMASGRMFLATASPASPLALLAEESRAGICVPPDEPKQLADTLEMLIGDKAIRQRFAHNGRSFVEKNVDRSVICRKIWSTLKTGSPYEFDECDEC